MCRNAGKVLPRDTFTMNLASQIIPLYGSKILFIPAIFRQQAINSALDLWWKIANDRLVISPR